MSQFPTSIPTLSNPTGANYLDDGGVVHADQHASANDEIEAIATKLGTGADTPVNGDFMVGTGTGTSGWRPATSADVGLPDTPNLSLASILSAVYPVGSIYISIVSTNPNTVFGFGTWVAFGTGRTIVGIDSGQTEFDVVEETGGAKTHTLTSAEMPAHTHPTYDNTSSGVAAGASTAYITNVAPTNGVTGSTGDGGAHNNLQPYIVVHMWKRTA